MSNSLAIAAITATLRNLLLAQMPKLDDGLQDLDVSTQPLDLVRKGANRPAQLNLYLYQSVVNAAWSNMDMPLRVNPGESAVPPLALNLRYVLTAYGRSDSENDVVNHRVLGAALAVLHDSPLLSRDQIAAALENNDLAGQIERLRVTPVPISVDELSKLWTAFQCSYRVSAIYEVTVVLIDSRRPVRSPLPVLRRGADDRGPSVTAGAAPLLRLLQIQRNQTAARLGEDVGIVGDRLPGEGAVVRFTSMRRKEIDADGPLAQVDLPAQRGERPGDLVVHLLDAAADPDALTRWIPGFYALSLDNSNSLAFALAPSIAVSPLAASAGTVLNIECTPRIDASQRLLVMLGDRQIAPATVNTPADGSKPSTVTAAVPVVEAGKYLVRLRVDGVDSNPLILAGSPPVPAYDPSQMVDVT